MASKGFVPATAPGAVRVSQHGSSVVIVIPKNVAGSVGYVPKETRVTISADSKGRLLIEPYPEISDERTDSQ